MRENDILCCNCDIGKITHANPTIDQSALAKYYYYMTERNNIYKKKEVLKQKYPWTDDPILRDNSFTCCKRWLDKTSKWLIENISNNKELYYEDRFWRTIIFRLYNKIETAELIKLADKDFWNNINTAMSALDNYPNDPFTRAYKVIKPKYAYRDVSPNGHDNWKSSLLWHIYTLYKKNCKHYLNIPYAAYCDANSAIEWLKSNIKGVGNFLAYQIFVDFTYLSNYPISEQNFVLSGPGCHAGLNMLFSDRDGLTDEELLFWLKDNINSIFQEYDNSYRIGIFFDYLSPMDRKWTVMDCENSMCEFSKYCYLLEGKHKRPRKYIPKKEYNL